MTLRLALAWCLSATSLALAQPSPETEQRDDDARTIFELGRDAYAQGRYEAALDHFRHAYELSSRPALLYNIGNAADRLRRDDEAVQAYRRYLVEVPNATNRAMVEQRIAFLSRGRGGSDLLPWILVLAGGAVAIAGGVFWAAGLVDLANVESADGSTWRELQPAYERSPILQGIGIAGVVAGLACAGLGLVLVLNAPSGAAELALGPGSLHLRVRF